MQVTLHEGFAKELENLADAIDQWSEDSRRRLVQAHRKIGERHKAEAVKRVPVDEGRLRNGIITRTHHNASMTDVLTETGTNVRGYPVYLEFGTRFIAGGRVLALGDGIAITDAEAVKDWPAKSAGQDGRIDKRGRFRTSTGQFVKGAGREQMPWLRPAFWAIRDWALKQLANVHIPPKQRK